MKKDLRVCTGSKKLDTIRSDFSQILAGRPGVSQCATEVVSLFVVYYIFRGVSSALLHCCYRDACLKLGDSTSPILLNCPLNHCFSYQLL